MYGLRRLSSYVRKTHNFSTLSSADLDEKRRRMLYHSKQRGWLEMDLILGSFAEKYLPTLSEADVDDYGTLLEEETPDMFKWMSGQASVPPELAQLPVTQLLLSYIREKSEH